MGDGKTGCGGKDCAEEPVMTVRALGRTVKYCEAHGNATAKGFIDLNQDITTKSL